jgi:hypothetical protein
MLRRRRRVHLPEMTLAGHLNPDISIKIHLNGDLEVQRERQLSRMPGVMTAGMRLN